MSGNVAPSCLLAPRVPVDSGRMAVYFVVAETLFCLFWNFAMSPPRAATTYFNTNCLFQTLPLGICRCHSFKIHCVVYSPQIPSEFQNVWNIVISVFITLEMIQDRFLRPADRKFPFFLSFSPILNFGKKRNNIKSSLSA